MKVFSLGLLRSTVFHRLQLVVPVEVRTRLDALSFGGANETTAEIQPLASWLSQQARGIVGLTMRVQPVLACPSHRLPLDMSLFELTLHPGAHLAVGIAAALELISRARLALHREDVCAVGSPADIAQHAPDFAGSADLLPTLAASLHVHPIYLMSLDHALEEAFGAHYARLLHAALEILLIEDHDRLRGRSVEAYRHLKRTVRENAAAFDAVRSMHDKSFDDTPAFVRAGVRLLELKALLTSSEATGAHDLAQLIEEAEHQCADFPVLLAQELYVDLARYLQDLRAFELAHHVLQQMDQLKERLGVLGLDDAIFFIAQARRGRACYYSGDFHAALQAYQETFEVLDNLGKLADTTQESYKLTWADLLNLAGKVFTDILDFPVALRLLAEAYSLRRAYRADHALSATLGAIAEVLARLGLYREALGLYGQDLDICEAKERLRVQNYMAVLTLLVDGATEADHAKTTLAQTLQSYEQEGSFAQASYSAMGLAMCAAVQGDTQALQRLYETWKGVGESMPCGMITLLTGVVAGLQYDWEEARQRITEAAEGFAHDSFPLEAAAAWLEQAVVCGTAAHWQEQTNASAVTRRLLVGGDPRSIVRFQAKQQTLAALENAENLVREFAEHYANCRRVFPYATRDVERWLTRLIEDGVMPESLSARLAGRQELLTRVLRDITQVRAAWQDEGQLDMLKLRASQRSLNFLFHVVTLIQLV